MKLYRWDQRRGLIDVENDTQALQITGGTRKFRNMAGKVLANQLNNMARGQALRKGNS